MTETFTGTIVVQEGRKRLAFNSPRYYLTRIRKLAEGAKVWVTVTDKAPSRSDGQNRLYWLYLTLIEEETGNDRDVLHEHFKQQYLKLPPRIVYTAQGEAKEVQLYRSTTTLSKAAFSEYMQKIERDTGVMIPEGERNHLLKGMAIDVRQDPRYPDGDSRTAFDE
ncbi:MAG: hypothetical protein KIT25_02875 [Enhydrobacter sp.]|nr:MAG: hypothetical protein KIT25_02875 [Enhydrobacter sp.]